MLLSARSFAPVTRVRRPSPHDPANDRQRMVAQAVVDAAWLAQVVRTAQRLLTKGPGQEATILSPCTAAYDAAEVEIVRAESDLREILRAQAPR